MNYNFIIILMNYNSIEINLNVNTKEKAFVGTNIRSKYAEAIYVLQ